MLNFGADGIAALAGRIVQQAQGAGQAQQQTGQRQASQCDGGILETVLDVADLGLDAVLQTGADAVGGLLPAAAEVAGDAAQAAMQEAAGAACDAACDAACEVAAEVACEALGSVVEGVGFFL